MLTLGPLQNSEAQNRRLERLMRTNAFNSTHFSINHNSGQHCQANSRVLVHRKIAETYVKELKQIFSYVKLGDPKDANTFQGCVKNFHLYKLNSDENIKGLRQIFSKLRTSFVWSTRARKMEPLPVAGADMETP